MTHRIRSRTESFERYLKGERHFELKVEDRRFEKGDTLELVEFAPCVECDGKGRVPTVDDQSRPCACLNTPHRKGRYTGRSVCVFITHTVHVVDTNKVILGVTQPEAKFSDEQVRAWCRAHGLSCAGDDLEVWRLAMLEARRTWPALVKVQTNADPPS